MKSVDERLSAALYQAFNAVGTTLSQRRWLSFSHSGGERSHDFDQLLAGAFLHNRLKQHLHHRDYLLLKVAYARSLAMRHVIIVWHNLLPDIAAKHPKTNTLLILIAMLAALRQQNFFPVFQSAKADKSQQRRLRQNYRVIYGETRQLLQHAQAAAQPYLSSAVTG